MIKVRIQISCACSFCLANPLVFVTKFHPGLPDIKGILVKFLPVLHQSPRMILAVTNAPMLSFRQPLNLKRLIVRAKVNNPSIPVSLHNQPCKSKRCKLCNLLDPARVISNDRANAHS